MIFMPIYTIRTTTGREDVVIDMLESNIKAESLDIKSVFHPAEIKGYIFVEGGLGSIQKGMRGLMHAKGLIEKPVRMEEISHFLEHKQSMIKVGTSDLVEIIGGPFKGERGEIKRIDIVKDEVTIELLEASIPIPVTIATEFIKIVKKAKSDEIGPVIAKPATPKEPEDDDEDNNEEKEQLSEKEDSDQDADEPSAFDLKAIKEREDARKDAQEEPGETESSADAEKAEQPKDAEGSEPKTSQKEEMDDGGFMGGILGELEREDKEKKKKRLKDLEYLEDE